MSKEAIKPLEAALDYKGDYAYDFMCKKIHQTIAILKEQPLASESDDWRKSATEFYELGGCPICFSTDEAGCTEGCYLGQQSAQLKAKDELLFAYESVRAPKQPPAGSFTKELRRKLSDSCCAIIEDLPGWWSMVAEARVMSFDACYRLDHSEASREELLDACEELVKFCYPDGKWRGWDNMKGILEIMQPIRRLAEKERKL